MEKEAINQAIREATGLDLDFAGDLNAMHEAEKMLDEGQQDTFIITLKRLVDVGLDDFQHEFNAIHATARQRAEGFLRTVGKWKE